MKILGLAFGFAFLTACSSSSSSPAGTTDGGADSGGSDPGAACGDLAAAYCAKFESCGQIPFELAFGDAAGCSARSSASCVAGLGASGTSATAASTEACSKAVSTASCDDFVNGKTQTACAVTAGTLADGAACGEDAQCKSMFCGKSGGAYCGKCGPVPMASATCDGRCGPGLVCVNKVCVVPGDMGAPCGAMNPCKPTLSCGAGMCKAPVAAGATCDPQQMTTAGCDAAGGYYCNTISKKCEKVTVSTTNQQCGVVRGGLTLCAADGFCRIPMNMATGVCIGAAADGAACDAAMGPICMAGSRCTGGKCVADDPATCK